MLYGNYDNLHIIIISLLPLTLTADSNDPCNKFGSYTNQVHIYIYIRTFN